MLKTRKTDNKSDIMDMDIQEDVNIEKTENENNAHADNDNSKDNKSTLPTQHRRITARSPQWTYFKLELIPHSRHLIKHLTIEPITARTYLTSALSQFLGLMGTSISIDILKIENWDEVKKPTTTAATTSTTPGGGRFPVVWIRVPRDDGAAVFAALSSWSGPLPSSTVAATTATAMEGASSSSSIHGPDDSNAESGVVWKICAKGNYLGAIVHGSGGEVFNP